MKKEKTLPSGKVLNKFSLITEIARPAFEAALSKKETITKAFELTEIFPYNPEAANREKLQTGTIFQQEDSNVEDATVTVDLLLDVVAHIDEDPGVVDDGPADVAGDPAVLSHLVPVALAEPPHTGVNLQRSLEDRSRETERDLLSQPGCSHWSDSQPPPSSGPPQTVQPSFTSTSSTPPVDGPPQGPASNSIVSVPEATRASVPVSSQPQVEIYPGLAIIDWLDHDVADASRGLWVPLAGSLERVMTPQILQLQRQFQLQLQLQPQLQQGKGEDPRKILLRSCQTILWPMFLPRKRDNIIIFHKINFFSSILTCFQAT